jgi:beta-galactosidase
LISRGGPKFVPGKTHEVTPRGYVRFTGSPADNRLIPFGLANPTRASSEAPGHSGRLANDGDTATFWQAADGDTNPWLAIDLERLVNMSQVKLTFPRPGAWRYKIEVSEDGENNWKLLTDQTQAGSVTADRVHNVQSGPVSGRFVRLTVVGAPDGMPAALAEMKVFGTSAAH